MKIKATIAIENLRDVEGKGGMCFVIFYAQKYNSLIFRRRKTQTKRGKTVWMGFITSSFHQVSVYTNPRPETGTARHDTWIIYKNMQTVNMHSKGVQTLNWKCIIGSEWDIRPVISYLVSFFSLKNWISLSQNQMLVVMRFCSPASVPWICQNQCFS